MNVERNYEKTCAQYEEADGTGVYKLARVPVDGEGWISTGQGVAAFIRALGERFQFFCFEERASEEAREKLETFLRSMPPLLAHGVVELWIGKDHHGWFVRDYSFETNGPIACDLPALTREHLKAALERVNELTFEDDVP